MSPDEPPILNNPMWLTPSSCDALPIHSYFGQRHNVTTLQATRTRIYLHQSLIWAGSGWMFIVKWYFANLIHWAGLVVLCCCFAWWQWSSFIHDADYCDNLSTESSAASHWSRSHLHSPHTTRDTELSSYDSLCHDQKRISWEIINVKKTRLLLDTWMFLPLHIAHDDELIFLFAWNVMIFFFKIGHEKVYFFYKSEILLSSLSAALCEGGRLLYYRPGSYQRPRFEVPWFTNPSRPPNCLDRRIFSLEF